MLRWRQKQEGGGGGYAEDASNLRGAGAGGGFAKYADGLYAWYDVRRCGAHEWYFCFRWEGLRRKLAQPRSWRS